MRGVEIPAPLSRESGRGGTLRKDLACIPILG